jgi:hypothetical protein
MRILIRTWIYLTYNFTVNSMDTSRLLKISLNEIILFFINLLVESISNKLITYRMYMYF